MRLGHVMLRVEDLEKTIDFYKTHFGMHEMKRSDNHQGQYTNVFIGYGDDLTKETTIELTYNWHQSGYDHGNAFGHLCFLVDDVYATCEAIQAKGGTIIRQPGPVKGGNAIIAFIEDPNGYKIELLQ